MSEVKIAPSIVSADLSRLADQVREVEAAGARMIHIDIMDGQFVPAITIGAPIVEAIRRSTELTLDIHLLVVEPEKQVERFIEAGGDIINVHWEAATHIHRIVRDVQQRGRRAGVCLNPGTSEGVLDALLPDLDQVMIMAVNPGASGQPFIASVPSCPRSSACARRSTRAAIERRSRSTAAGRWITRRAVRRLAPMFSSPRAPSSTTAPRSATTYARFRNRSLRYRRRRGKAGESGPLDAVLRRRANAARADLEADGHTADDERLVLDVHLELAVRPRRLTFPAPGVLVANISAEACLFVANLTPGHKIQSLYVENGRC